jgi:pyruvate formate lyase activating enzyme
MTGRIFDIKRFAIHDGPGIRTTVFLKGCSMNCLWCQNPEGLGFGEDIWVKREECIRCGACVAACPEKALSLGPEGIRINREACNFCGRCTEICPPQAIRRIDRETELEPLVRELTQDRLFFDTSGGGVTLSGGESLAQPEFALALLERLKALGIHTCIETALLAPDAVIRRLPGLLDQLICDIKIMDREAHRKYTGVDNAPILDNFKYLVSSIPNILVRVPLVSGITATEENLRAIGGFVRSCGADINIELLNYNWFSGSKYALLDKPHFDSDARAFPEDEMTRFYAWVRGSA